MQLPPTLELALLYIDGGGNNEGGGLGNPPSKMDTMTGLICQTAGAVVARTYHFPLFPKFSSSSGDVHSDVILQK